MLECIIEQQLLTLPGSRDFQSEILEHLFETVPLSDKRPFRLDHRTQPMVLHGEIRSFTSESSVSLPEDITIAGHNAYIRMKYDKALEFYDRALAAGAPEGPLQVDRGLTLLRQGDWLGAKKALDLAASILPDDVEVRELREVMGP
jgi:tetratricopeptide (TPR) repeat protein